jgi:hypothetical protein
MRALLLAFTCQQPYHTLRAAAAAGYSVHVLARGSAKNLKYSRYCSSYHHFNYDPVSGSLDEALAEITRQVTELSIDLIVPTDIISTRLLVALAGRLPVPTPALPDANCFDTLNDKWRFYQFCRDHGVGVPQTWAFDDVDAVKAAINEGALGDESLPFPLIVKPLDSSGGFGIHRIMDKADLKTLDDVQYKPLLAQKMIVGDEVDISVLANKGRIVAYAIQRNLPDKYIFIRHDALLAQASRIVEESGLHGLAHFDAIIEKTTGDVYLIECNPRAWMSIFASKVAGLNFIELSIKPESLDPATPLALIDKEVDDCGSTVKLIVKLMRERSTNKPDYNLLKYNLADPIGKKRSREKGIDAVSFIETAAGSVEYQVAALSALRKPV